MKLSSLKYKEGSRSGVTLVELLVVMLIATILAVSMLPFLQKFITRAQYVAEAIPVVGSVRVELGLYYFDKNGLPGTTSNVVSSGTALTSNIDSTGQIASRGAGVQTFVPFMNVDTATECYARAMFGDAAPGFTTGSKPPETAFSDPDVDNRHFASTGQLDANYIELTGKKMRPNDFQYIVPYESGNTYIYAMGVFGCGKKGGLKGGTGYAVLEIVDPTNNRKILATWELYKPSPNSDGSQLTFHSGVAQGSKSANSVWVPNEDYVGSSDTASTLISQLVSEGWSVTDNAN